MLVKGATEGSCNVIAAFTDDVNPWLTTAPLNFESNIVNDTFI